MEAAPLEPCVKMVAEMKRNDKAKENAKKEAEKRKRIEETMSKITEDRKELMIKSKKVTMQEP